MKRRPPRSTRTDTLFPYTTLFRSLSAYLDGFEPVEPLLTARDGTLMARIEEAMGGLRAARSEEHTSELQSLMRISYAVFCLKKKNKQKQPYSNDASNHTYSNQPHGCQ